jgi:hypothetical protein
VTQTNDTQEICGIDSKGELIPFERYCEALGLFKNVFTVCYLEGVFIKDPKRESTEVISKQQDSLLMQLLPRPSSRPQSEASGGTPVVTKTEKSKKADKNGAGGTAAVKKLGMSIFYQTLEY